MTPSVTGLVAPLAALNALPGPGVRAGAEALVELCDLYGLRRVDELVDAWLARHGHTE